MVMQLRRRFVGVYRFIDMSQISKINYIYKCKFYYTFKERNIVPPADTADCSHPLLYLTGNKSYLCSCLSLQINMMSWPELLSETF